MMDFSRAVLLGALFIATVLAGKPAAAQSEAFYFGRWTVASAVVAPWAPASPPPDDREMKALTGKTLGFGAKSISGPGILACPAPRYSVVGSPPEGLFQGAFEEMHRTHKAADPAALARKYGFKAHLARTLETGCANEIDYHFVDDRTAEFALNDYIYTIRRK